MSDFEIKKLFISLEGNWKIDRTFSSSDKRFNAPKASGLATFKRVNPLFDILIYSEKLILSWQNGKVNECHQNYIYEYKDGIISKHQLIKNIEINSKTIKEHTKMYDLAFCHLNVSNQASAKGTFKCNYDSYNSQFKFKSSDNFSISYSVLGPYKKYDTYSEYMRQSHNHAFKEKVS